MSKKITKILIANRGEIARRVIRTARKMGIQTVAVYSDADEFSPHVLEADQACYIGKSPSSESYLCIDKIIQAALESGADAIHPGYGFLSENAEFAKQVKKSKLIFIGPSEASILTMGSKLAAKALAEKYNIPLVPGTSEPVTDLVKAKKRAKEIGYPILIKASAGGGGKGMRIVSKESEFESQMKRAMSEAENSFGDPSVFIEKFVEKPRHIEIQILADKKGNTVHLFERECSIQRRHQKVIEEAPSSILDDKLRKKMGDCAVKIAKACRYEGAGTVEFLLDKDLNFYFLEMNTRLQVEHPVTELITGIDLVEQQIRVAQSETLFFTQKELKIKGHAIEMRVYAEDPYDDFLPDIGTLTVYKEPVAEGVRVDGGFREGMPVPIYYDPMISKLICYASTREKAIEKSLQAIDEYFIGGIKTTLPFCSFALAHKSFKEGNFDTHFVKKYFTDKQTHTLSEKTLESLALFSVCQHAEKEKKDSQFEDSKPVWKLLRT